MRETTASCVVQASGDALWGVVADYSRLLRLASPDATAKIIDGEPGSIGARYEACVSWEGMKAQYVVTLTEAVRPSTVTWKSSSHGGSCGAHVGLDDLGDGTTTVTVTLRYSANRANRPLEPFAWGLLVPFLKRTMKQLPKLDSAEWTANAAS